MYGGGVSATNALDGGPHRVFGIAAHLMDNPNPRNAS
jgi:hypothetical protein